MRQMLSKIPVGLLVGMWVISCSAVELCAATQYTTTALGELITANVNDAAHVLGQFYGRPAVWKDGAIMVMQSPGIPAYPERWSEAGNGISVGSVTYPGTAGAQGAAQWDASGVLTLLAQNPAYGSIAFSQNAAGVTVGVHGRFDAAYGGPVSSAARWDTPQTLTILDTRDGQWSESRAIDGEGNVWGIDQEFQPVIWDRQGNKRLIPGNPGRWTGIDMVNESGVGAGTSTNPPQPFVTVPVQATAAGFSVLPQLDGATCTPVDINLTGTIAGNCTLPNTTNNIPVLWEHGAISRLPLTIPREVEGFYLAGLSDSGLLVGHGFTRVGDPDGPPQGSLTHGFLFTPVPITFAPPSLALSLNQSTFQPDQTLRVTLDLSNPGPILTTDVYVGVILPDGENTLFLTNVSPLEGVITTLSSDPRTFARLLSNVSWPAGMRATQQDYFTHTFTGLEPLGTYHFLVSWTKPNSLEDGRIDEGDVLALAWAPFTFTRGSTQALYAKMQAIRARQAK